MYVCETNKSKNHLNCAQDDTFPRIINKRLQRGKHFICSKNKSVRLNQMNMFDIQSKPNVTTREIWFYELEQPCTPGYHIRTTYIQIFHTMPIAAQAAHVTF